MLMFPLVETEAKRGLEGCQSTSIKGSLGPSKSCLELQHLDPRCRYCGQRYEKLLKESRHQKREREGEGEKERLNESRRPRSQDFA